MLTDFFKNLSSATAVPIYQKACGGFGDWMIYLLGLNVTLHLKCFYICISNLKDWNFADYINEVYYGYYEREAL